jgi:hypothetical protein
MPASLSTHPTANTVQRSSYSLTSSLLASSSGILPGDCFATESRSNIDGQKNNGGIQVGFVPIAVGVENYVEKYSARECCRA